MVTGGARGGGSRQRDDKQRRSGNISDIAAASRQWMWRMGEGSGTRSRGWLLGN